MGLRGTVTKGQKEWDCFAVSEPPVTGWAGWLPISVHGVVP
jgi:hypothetical protein